MKSKEKTIKKLTEKINNLKQTRLSQKIDNNEKISQEISAMAWNYLLYYESLDQHFQEEQKDDDDMYTMKTIFTMKKKKKEIKSLNMNKELISFLLISTLDEIQNFCLFFLKQIHKRGNFRFNKDEFIEMIGNLDKNTNLSEPKIKSTVIRIMMKGKFAKITEFFSKNKNQHFSNVMMNRLFDYFKSETPILNKEINKSEYLIDSINFLPIFLGFYLEHYRLEILNRRNQLEAMIGKHIHFNLNVGKGDYILQEKNNNNNTLKKRFQMLGVSIKEGKEFVSYLKIEEVLISFRSLIKSKITEEQIELILKEIRGLMQVDSFTKIEKKQFTLNKIVKILSLKICLHSSLYELSKIDSKDSALFISENILWNCASYADILSEQKIKNKFRKYIKKINEGDDLEKNINFHLINFFKEQIPLLTLETCEKIIREYEIHDKIDWKKFNFEIFLDLEAHIFKIVENGAEYKLTKYISYLVAKLGIQKHYERNNAIISNNDESKNISNESIPGEPCRSSSENSNNNYSHIRSKSQTLLGFEKLEKILEKRHTQKKIIAPPSYQSLEDLLSSSSESEKNEDLQKLIEKTEKKKPTNKLDLKLSKQTKSMNLIPLVRNENVTDSLSKYKTLKESNKINKTDFSKENFENEKNEDLNENETDDISINDNIDNEIEKNEIIEKNKINNYNSDIKMKENSTKRSKSNSLPKKNHNSIEKDKYRASSVAKKIKEKTLYVIEENLEESMIMTKNEFLEKLHKNINDKDDPYYLNTGFTKEDINNSMLETTEYLSFSVVDQKIMRQNKFQKDLEYNSFIGKKNSIKKKDSRNNICYKNYLEFKNKNRGACYSNCKIM